MNKYYKFIINPNNNYKYNIKSNEGIKLLKKYILFGGADAKVTENKKTFPNKCSIHNGQLRCNDKWIGDNRQKISECDGLGMKILQIKEKFNASDLFNIGDKYEIKFGNRVPNFKKTSNITNIFDHSWIEIYSKKNQCKYSLGLTGGINKPVSISFPDQIIRKCKRRSKECIDAININAEYFIKNKHNTNNLIIKDKKDCKYVCGGIININEGSFNKYHPNFYTAKEGKLEYVHILILDFLLKNAKYKVIDYIIKLKQTIRLLNRKLIYIIMFLEYIHIITSTGKYKLSCEFAEDRLSKIFERKDGKYYRLFNNNENIQNILQKNNLVKDVIIKQIKNIWKKNKKIDENRLCKSIYNKINILEEFIKDKKKINFSMFNISNDIWINIIKNYWNKQEEYLQAEFIIEWIMNISILLKIDLSKYNLDIVGFDSLIDDEWISTALFTEIPIYQYSHVVSIPLFRNIDNFRKWSNNDPKILANCQTFTSDFHSCPNYMYKILTGKRINEIMKQYINPLEKEIIKLKFQNIFNRKKSLLYFYKMKYNNIINKINNFYKKINRETLALPGDRETLALPADRETLALPGDRETLALPADREILELPSNIINLKNEKQKIYNKIQKLNIKVNWYTVLNTIKKKNTIKKVLKEIDKKNK